MRAFFALNLDVASTGRLCEAAQALRARAGTPDARWVAPTKMHVTVRFLGDVDVGLAPALLDAMAASRESDTEIRVTFERVSAFPSIERARVIVVLLQDAASRIRRLAARLEERLVALGIPPEPRALVPHVTLARTLRSQNVGSWLDGAVLPAEPAWVTELVLYRSDMASGAYEYASLGRIGFGAGPERFEP